MYSDGISQTDKSNKEGTIYCIFSGSQVVNFHFYVCLSLMIVFTSTNSVDSDEMPQYAAFHLVKVPV